MASKSKGEKVILMPEQISTITESRDDILKGFLEQIRLLTALIEKELGREKQVEQLSISPAVGME